MPSITASVLTGSEIKRNCTNCGVFRLIQEGCLENKSELHSRHLIHRGCQGEAAETQEALSPPVVLEMWLSRTVHAGEDWTSVSWLNKLHLRDQEICMSNSMGQGTHGVDKVKGTVGNNMLWQLTAGIELLWAWPQKYERVAGVFGMCTQSSVHICVGHRNKKKKEEILWIPYIHLFYHTKPLSCIKVRCGQQNSHLTPEQCCFSSSVTI